MSQIGSDLRKRTDISILKSNYGKTVLPITLDWTCIWIHSEESVRDYRIWLFAFLHWVFDESDRVPPSSYLLWLCHYSDKLVDNTEDTMVLNFFLRRVEYGEYGKFNRLQYCLRLCAERGLQFYLQRFLDAGAYPPLNSGPTSDLYISRLETRAAIYAFFHCLSSRNGRQDLRAYAPRDIQKLIAKMIWNHRFEFN